LRFSRRIRPCHTYLPCFRSNIESNRFEPL
jgi:hypothetical protein